MEATVNLLTGVASVSMAIKKSQKNASDAKINSSSKALVGRDESPLDLASTISYQIVQ